MVSHQAEQSRERRRVEAAERKELSPALGVETCTEGGLAAENPLGEVPRGQPGQVALQTPQAREAGSHLWAKIRSFRLRLHASRSRSPVFSSLETPLCYLVVIRVETDNNILNIMQFNLLIVLTNSLLFRSIHLNLSSSSCIIESRISLFSE